jgi:hypothetical protein
MIGLGVAFQAEPRGLSPDLIDPVHSDGSATIEDWTPSGAYLIISAPIRSTRCSGTRGLKNGQASGQSINDQIQMD